jgi:SAM-dependent methyltransferase
VFDAVFSNAVLHWVLEPAKAVAGIAQALKPGGRLVCEFGGKRNLELIYGAMMAVRADMGNPLPRLPKYFPDIVAFGALVQANGLEVRSAWLIDRLTPLENGEAGMRDWMAMFGDRLLADLPLEQQRVVIERSEASLRADLYRDGQWFADYRRLRMVAVKTGG